MSNTDIDIDLSTWERFDEGFDEYNGGALYVSDNGDDTVSAAGAIWMDATGDEKPYYAFITLYDVGQDTYADVMVNNQYDAAEAFSGAVNCDVYHPIGEFDTMQEAIDAVKEIFAGVE